MTPHIVRREFLSDEECARLLAWALDNAQRFRPAALSGGRVNEDIRRSLSLRDMGAMGAIFKEKMAAAAAGLIEDLRVTPFEISHIELELVAHNHGAHFQRHIDTYTTTRSKRGDRMLSAVYYFHREPKAFAGGALRLHAIGDPPDEDGQDVAPDQNTLVVFPSWGPHEVLPVSCSSGAFEDSRFAVNCWLYRPAKPA